MEAQLILETSISLLLSPEDMGFYIGPYMREASDENDMNAHSFIFKLWIVMAQITVFSTYKND